MGELGLIPGLGRSPGEGVATQSSILACRIPLVDYSLGSHKESDMTKPLGTLMNNIENWSFMDCTVIFR